MTKYNWNFEVMGFASESEMKESIARVERKMKMNPLEYEIERRRETQNDINEGVGINFAALKEGARLEELDRVVHNRMIYDREQAKLQAEQEDIQNLFKATAEKITAENESTAQRELQKQKEKAESDLQKEIYSKHGVKTDEQQAQDEAYSSMLDNLIK